MPSNDQPAPAPAAQAESSTPIQQSEAPKLTGAELKKQKQAEKAARRAQAIQGKHVIPAGPPPAVQKGEPKQQKRRGSTAGSRDLPIRQPESNAAPKPPPVEDKTVEFFRHLSKPHRKTIAGTPKDIHPAAQILGMQFSTYVICGSTARLLATLEVFKEVRLSQSTLQILMLISSARPILCRPSSNHLEAPFHHPCPQSPHRLLNLFPSPLYINGERDILV